MQRYCASNTHIGLRSQKNRISNKTNKGSRAGLILRKDISNIKQKWERRRLILRKNVLHQQKSGKWRIALSLPLSRHYCECTHPFLGYVRRCPFWPTTFFSIFLEFPQKLYNADTLRMLKGPVTRHDGRVTPFSACCTMSPGLYVGQVDLLGRW